MITILSPAKNMNIKKFNNNCFTPPIFKNKTTEILNELKKLEAFQIESLMKVNKDIAFKTFCNFVDFDIDKKIGNAILCYDGLVFKNINAIDFNASDVSFSENHLRILSALYGILTPLTNISPYRLEMSCKLKILGYSNLYKFWGNSIYKELFKTKDIVINLASKEYTKVITPFLLDKDKFITISFFKVINGQHRIVATSAKMARGQMAKFIIKNKVNNIENLKEFTFDNYTYNDFLSNKENLIFLQN